MYVRPIVASCHLLSIHSYVHWDSFEKRPKCSLFSEAIIQLHVFMGRLMDPFHGLSLWGLDLTLINMENRHHCYLLLVIVISSYDEE